MLTDVYFCETLAQQRRVVVGDWGCWLWCARHFLRHFVRLSVGIVVGSRREASALLPAARDKFVDKTVVFAFLSVLFGLAFLLLFCQ